MLNDCQATRTVAIASPERSDKWHLDEMFLKINGVRHYRWRAVDQNGVAIDILVQPKRDCFAASSFFRKLLKLPAVVGSA